MLPALVELMKLNPATTLLTVVGALEGQLAQARAQQAAQGNFLNADSPVQKALAGKILAIVREWITRLGGRDLKSDGGVAMDGTSMATPLTTGVVAALKSAYQDATPGELKAMLMNTATHDLTTQPLAAGSVYTPARIGAGRVDAKNASQSLDQRLNRMLATVYPLLRQ